MFGWISQLSKHKFKSAFVFFFLWEQLQPFRYGVPLQWEVFGVKICADWLLHSGPKSLIQGQHVGRESFLHYLWAQEIKKLKLRWTGRAKHNDAPQHIPP